MQQNRQCQDEAKSGGVGDFSIDPSKKTSGGKTLKAEGT